MQYSKNMVIDVWRLGMVASIIPMPLVGRIMEVVHMRVYDTRKDVIPRYHGGSPYGGSPYGSRTYALRRWYSIIPICSGNLVSYTLL